MIPSRLVLADATIALPAGVCILVLMIEPVSGGVVLSVRVIPRAGRTGLAGIRGGALLVRVAAPPVDGAANAELMDALAAALGVPTRDVSIVAGARGRQKRVLVAGVDAAAARVRLALPDT